MKDWGPLRDDIDLHVSGRISEKDALRQTRTAQEILRRFSDRPGVVLADEVGMGKTFVALAVAVSVSLADKRRRPVVVMVPPSLREKWPRDFALFTERCLPPETATRLRAETANSAVELLRLLDDPLEQRASLIFLTHGAMHRGLDDPWVRLAIIQRALKGRRNIDQLRRSVARFMGKILRQGAVGRQYGEEVWASLLAIPVGRWGDELGLEDDPVPESVAKVLRKLDVSGIYHALCGIPRRTSPSLDQRLKDCRDAVSVELKEVWRRCLAELRFKLPLLILDEAHHLKNPGTRLAGLFQTEEARGDSEELVRGALAGVFERMLFLTATPFQLGHHELCSVLERFGGIAWKSASAPSMGREKFTGELEELRDRLDRAQHAALGLDAAWGELRPDDLASNVAEIADAKTWWAAIEKSGAATEAGRRAKDCYERTWKRMREAEELLRPWVIRHLHSPQLPGWNVPRRVKLPGRAIETEDASHEAGLGIGDGALLPFLLAARAALCAPESRPVFAEGLASSYEAFLETRAARSSPTDDDDEPADDLSEAAKSGKWYLDQLESAIPTGGEARAAHPKVAATVRRALAAWEAGEKVLVFCHYRATGRVLRREISRQLHERIASIGAAKLGCAPGQVHSRLERLGNRFFDRDSPVRRECDRNVDKLLVEFPGLEDHRAQLLEVARRFLRTPGFLVRFFPLESGELDEKAVQRAFDKGDGSDTSLLVVLRGFFKFLEQTCGPAERAAYLDAMSTVLTGSMAKDEIQGERQHLLPNVRLVNGSVGQETRQRLMLTFNSPFFPEILIASSVMAEGVDLHRCCRHVIHHDLSWNPSTLEQRTGRIDRIGSKAEACGQSIRVYLPYVAATQDEKMYRVVTDRERWFGVVMGERYDVNVRTTEKLADRVPLPEPLARDLAFRLEAQGRCNDG